ncbi:MAG: type II toxin-antitoxin system Phd/YefM family antitoxin [Desulfuromonadales bacterium]|nr:type II toxin-antitoxin system Phd/YefM family antitoxin [Desulfuromonadales bacterium]
METTVDLKTFRQNFGEFLDTVQRDKDATVIVTRYGNPWVVLRSPAAFARTDGFWRERALKVRLELVLLLGTVHYQKKPLLVIRKGEPAACVCPPGDAPDMQPI